MKWNLRLAAFPIVPVLFALLVWSLLILRFGYRFGTGDQVEILPYTLSLHDPSLYSKDFVIQALRSSVPNERTVIAYILLPFVNHLEVACLILHALSSVLLILGLMRLAEMFIKNKYLAWLTVPVSLIVLNDYALGNLELYTDCLQGGLISVAIIAWALVYFLRKRFMLSVVLMSVASIIHVLEGLDVMMVLSALLFISYIRKEISLAKLVSLLSVYAFTAGLYLIAVFVAKQGKAEISNATLFQILFEFRHSHHFLLSAFPKFKMLVFFLLTAFSALYFKERSRTVHEFVLLGLVGVLVYALVVDAFHFVPIANFQFYRITTWMKFLGVIAALGWMEEWVKRFLPSFGKLTETLVLSAGLAGCWLIIASFTQHLPYKVPFELFGLKERDDMIAICEKIKSTTPRDALFIQPFDNSELKYYGQRSSYVEFKANVHDKKYVAEWYRRIQLVYGLSISNSQKGFELRSKADEYFYTADSSRLDNWRREGVSHLLVKKNFEPSFGKLILANDSYAVYQL